MADENNTTETTAPENGQQFAIQKIYIKDVSFESPNSPSIFTEQFNPEVNLQLNTNGTAIADNVYEVVWSLTVTVKQEDKTAYLVEVQQCGIFTMQGFSEQDMGGMLGSFCPNILLPAWAVFFFFFSRVLLFLFASLSPKLTSLIYKERKF